jgi:4'-phosphopantetheinyl transferase EntD
VSNLLSSLFGPEVQVATSPLIYTEADLLPEERPLCERAIDKRKREVATGRVLARQVLTALGYPPQPILRSPDRAPIWPPGSIGTIAHEATLCIVAAARTTEVATLGVDVEANTPLQDNLHSMILVPPEARWLETQPPADRGQLAKLIFSAKETAYKTQYPQTKKMLEFTDVELKIDRTRRTFETSILPGHEGFYIINETHIITGLKIPAK